MTQHYNQLDIQLYQYAQERFEQQISQYLGDFERELKSCKLLNQQYGNVTLFTALSSVNSRLLAANSVDKKA